MIIIYVDLYMMPWVFETIKSDPSCWTILNKVCLHYGCWRNMTFVRMVWEMFPLVKK